MKRILLLIPFTVLVVVLLSATFLVRAVCDPADTGTTGNDTIECTVANAPAGNVQGLDGDDTIIIGSGVNAPVIVAGDSSTFVTGGGDDTIINDGSVSSIYGDNRNAAGSGNDTIVNNGYAGLISGESQNGLSNTGNDTIVNNGTAGSINGDSINSIGSGDDSITNNGTVTGDVRGDSFIGAGSGNDSIVNNGTITGLVTGDSLANNGSGNDNITNNGNIAGSVIGDASSGIGSGNDTIINNGYIGGDVTGDTVSPAGSGSDSITNNGTVVGSIYGDNLYVFGTGSDTIVNTGNVTNIYGDNQFGSEGGNDTITNAGTVTGVIIASYGNDTVIIEANTANVGGVIDGGADYDVLTFNLTSASPAQMQEWADMIFAANPAGGTLTLNGHTYTWTNFEELTQLLFTLVRINDIGDPLAVFCSQTDGMDVYAVSGDEGFLSLNVSAQAISNGIAAAAESDTTVQIGNSAEAVVYATSSGDVQVNAPNGFSFNFAYQNFCGALPVAGAVVVVAEEEVEDVEVIINRPR